MAPKGAKRQSSSPVAVVKVEHGDRMRLMGRVAFALCLLAPAATAAKTSFADSLQWLCVQSDRVLAGRILAVKAVDAAMEGRGRVSPRGGRGQLGKNTALVLLRVRVTATLNGTASDRDVCVGVRHHRTGKFVDWKQNGTELVFFLKDSIQATSHWGLRCNGWPVASKHGDLHVVPLDNPARVLFSAESFSPVAGQASILGVCRRVREALARLPPGSEPRRSLLQIPPGTPAHEALFAGSACYLYVPDLLYPAARRQ